MGNERVVPAEQSACRFVIITWEVNRQASDGAKLVLSQGTDPTSLENLLCVLWANAVCQDVVQKILDHHAVALDDLVGICAEDTRSNRRPRRISRAQTTQYLLTRSP